MICLDSLAGFPQSPEPDSQILLPWLLWVGVSSSSFSSSQPGVLIALLG